MITSIQPDHVGQDGTERVGGLVHIKSLVAERVREGGTLVFNAEDARVAAMVELPRVARLRRQTSATAAKRWTVLVQEKS